MKRIFFAALLAWMTAALSLSAQTPRHPYLLYTPQRIEQAKQLMKDEPARKAGWEAIKQRADKALEGGNRLDESEYLSLAYLMTGDKRYANKQKAILLDVIKDRAWSSSEMLARKPVWRADLNVSHRCRLAAIAYDAIYNILSRDERKEITQGYTASAWSQAWGTGCWNLPASIPSTPWDTTGGLPAPAWAGCWP